MQGQQREVTSILRKPSKRIDYKDINEILQWDCKARSLRINYVTEQSTRRSSLLWLRAGKKLRCCILNIEKYVTTVIASLEPSKLVRGTKCSQLFNKESSLKPCTTVIRSDGMFSLEDKSSSEGTDHSKSSSTRAFKTQKAEKPSKKDAHHVFLVI